MRRRGVAGPAALVVALGLAAAAPPLAADAPASAECGPAQEVCRVTVRHASGGAWSVETRTATPHAVFAYLTLRAGTDGSGAVLCADAMGFDETRTCDADGHAGALTATFLKGAGTRVVLTLRRADG